MLFTELYDKLDQVMEEGIQPFRLIEAGGSGYEQEFWMSIKDAQLTMMIRSMGSKVTDSCGAKETLDWYWLDEDQTRKFTKIAAQSRMAPILLFTDYVGWEDALQKLQKVLCDNGIEYTHDRELI